MTIYTYLAEKGDRRTTQYKRLDYHLETLSEQYGKNSKQVNAFFDSNLQSVLDSME